MAEGRSPFLGINQAVSLMMEDRLKKEREACTGVTDTCPDMECMACGERECPHNEPLHFHHDGCPACSGP